VAGEDLLEGTDGGSNDTGSASGPGSKKKKPLSKGQKIGLVIGLVTIALVVIQIERSKSAASSAATSTSTPIDPETGYPEGSAQDQAALANLAAQSGGGSYGAQGGSDGYGSSDSSGASDTDPATGISYSSEIGTINGTLGTLGTDLTGLESQFSTFQSDVPPATTPSTTPTAATTPTTTTTSPTSSSTANPALNTTLANLAKDEAAAAKDPTAKNTAAVKALTERVSQITTGKK
jgi:hypothetical protein